MTKRTELKSQSIDLITWKVILRDHVQGHMPKVISLYKLARD